MVLKSTKTLIIIYGTQPHVVYSKVERFWRLFLIGGRELGLAKVFMSLRLMFTVKTVSAKIGKKNVLQK